MSASVELILAHIVILVDLDTSDHLIIQDVLDGSMNGYMDESL